MKIEAAYKILVEVYDKSIFPTWDDWQKINKLKCLTEKNNLYSNIHYLERIGLINSRKKGCLEIQLTYSGAEIVQLIKKIEKIENKKIKESYSPQSNSIASPSSI
jgi:hypothetical protein